MNDRKELIKLKCDLLLNGLRLNELRSDLVETQGWEKTELHVSCRLN
ncbi:MAG: hypothetical protein R3A12_10800 [Ignavibacteria bacterium]